MLSRRHFFFGSFAGSVLGLPAFGAVKPVNRPSVLLLTADDLPSWVLGSYGNKEVRTPNLDRLAQMGTRFERHIVCIPTGAPSLASMLTGLSPMQLGGTNTPPAGAATLDSLLSSAGYACQAADPSTAAAFLDQQTAAKPFFLRVHFGKLGRPGADVPQKYLELYANSPLETFGKDVASPNAAEGKALLADRLANQRKMAAAISAFDERVQSVFGRIAARRLTDTTLVIFTSTCGALLGRHGLWDAGDASNPPNMYRESVETPLIWVWPGQIPAQGVRPELVSSYDLLPTLSELLGISLPKGNLCGRSYALLATGKPLPKKQPWRTTVFGQLRQTGMSRIERYKLVLHEGKGGELYDLRADPSEGSNQYENPQFLTIRNQLASELAGWQHRYSS